jgi:hypothetical protein
MIANANAAKDVSDKQSKPVTVIRDAKGNELQASAAAPVYTLVNSGLWFYATKFCPIYMTPYYHAISSTGASYLGHANYNPFACSSPNDIIANYSAFYPNHLRGSISVVGDFYSSFITQNPPTATASGATSGTTGQAIVFTGGGTVDTEFSKDKALTYFWTFGNGASATGQSVSYAYPNSGNYVVTLKTFDGTYYSQPVTINVAIAGANTGLGVPQLSAFFDSELCEKEISWTAVNGATTYRLERLLSTTWSEIANTSEQYHVDAGPGSRSYRVKACNSSACGEFSNVVRSGGRCYTGTPR